MKSNSGRDYLVLWTYDEALDVEGEAMTGSVGTHAKGLSSGDRMFIVATHQDELYFLGAIRVEQSGIGANGKAEAKGTNLTGPFRILPFKEMKWRLTFKETASPKLDKHNSLTWQVRSRRKLSPDSAKLLFDLLSQKQKRIERNIKFQDGRVWVGMMSRRERGIRKAALKARGLNVRLAPLTLPRDTASGRRNAYTCITWMGLPERLVRVGRLQRMMCGLSAPIATQRSTGARTQAIGKRS
jgi:hypothetical protein